MKITILGSSGQIGAYLTEYLRGKNHEVTEFDVARHHGEDLTQIPNHNLDRAIKNADFEPLESFEQKVTMMGRASLVLRKMSSSFKLAEKQASFQKKKSRPAKR